MEPANDTVHAQLAAYEEDERLYKEIYEQQTCHPESFSAWLGTLDRETILRRRLYIPALQDEPWYPFLEEAQVFDAADGPVKVARHYRYTPVFEHQHGFFEVLCLYEGQAQTTIQGVPHTLRTGDICILPPGTRHSVGIFDDSIALNLLIRRASFQSTFFGLVGSSSALSQFFSHALFQKTEGNYLIFHAGADPLIRTSLEDLYTEYSGRQKYSGEFLCTLLMLFWARLLRYHEQQVECCLPGDHGTVSVPRILDYLNAHYQTVTLSQAAGHFGFSAPHFSALIKESTGRTFLQLLRGIKLDQACRALRETSLSVAAVAEIAGYQSPEHFMRTFKKEYGVTPAAYRKASR